MEKVKILVTGVGGQLGISLLKIQLNYPNFEIHGFNRNELNILDTNAIEKVFKTFNFKFCINAAAFTKVDLAEKEREQCYKVNVDGPENLATICHNYNCTLIHISSDYVYHPAHNRILTEESPTLPKGIYAKSKLEGERRIQVFHDKVIVLRTSWVYGYTDSNFVKTMLKLSQNLKEIKVVSDQVGSPTFANDLAICCLDLIEIIENTDQFEGYGIYNFSNEGFISWFEFAQVIFKKTGKEVIVKPIPTEAYPTAAERPLNSRLSKEKITTLLKKAPRNWMAALNDYLEDIS